MWCADNQPPILDFGLTPFAQAMPDQYKDPNPVVAYRKYYIAEKSKIALWRHSDTPTWFTQGLRHEQQV